MENFQETWLLLGRIPDSGPLLRIPALDPDKRGRDFRNASPATEAEVGVLKSKPRLPGPGFKNQNPGYRGRGFEISTPILT